MKVIVSPGPSFQHNPFFVHLNAGLTAHGDELLSPRLRHLISADLFLIHFPEHAVSLNKNLIRAFASVVMTLGFMLALKLRNCPIIWMAHNVSALQRHHPRLSAFYMCCIRKMVSGYIFISQSSRREFERIYPGERRKPMLTSVHPKYPVRILGKQEKTDIREKLGIGPDEFLIGYLGDIKQYKNPEILRHVPEHLENGRKTALLVVGRPDGHDQEYQKYITHPRYIHIDKRVSDEGLASYIQAVDIVLLPYAWSWNSGFLFLILSCLQRSLTSNLPIFMELQEQFGTEWVTTFDLTAADQKNAIIQAVNEVSKKTRDANETAQLKKQLEEFSFTRLASDVHNFCGTVIKGQ